MGAFAILSTFIIDIKLPFVFVLSIFEWPFYTSFTVGSFMTAEEPPIISTLCLLMDSSIGSHTIKLGTVHCAYQGVTV